MADNVYLYTFISHKNLVRIEEDLLPISALYILTSCGGYSKSYVARLILVVESSFFFKWKLDHELCLTRPTSRVLSRTVFCKNRVDRFTLLWDKNERKTVLKTGYIFFKDINVILETQKIVLSYRYSNMDLLFLLGILFIAH